MSKRAIFLGGKRGGSVPVVTTTTTWQVSHSGDDGSGIDSGIGSTVLSSLQAGNETYAYVTNIGYYAFFRFLNVGIPQGANIHAAKLTLRTRDAASGGTEGGDLDLYTFKVDALDVNSSTRPASDSSVFNDLADSTTAVVDWTLTSSVSDDADLDTPEIKTVLQEVVDRGGWLTGSNVTFRTYNTKTTETSPTGVATCLLHISAHETATSTAAKLTVTYSS